MTNRNVSKTNESADDSNDTPEEADAPETQQKRVTWAQGTSLMARSKLVEIDGEEYLQIPLSEFKWIVCIPHTSTVELSRADDGMTKRVIPRRYERMGDDWGLHVEVWLMGILMPPFKRLSVYIDREDEGFPILKWEMIG